VAVAIITVILVAFIAGLGLTYWDPVRFSFTLVADGGGSSAATMAYETWQNWAIHLQGGGVASYVSASKSFGFPISLGGSAVGRLYYTEVQIPIRQVGQLPSENLLSGSCTPSTWYNQIEVYAKAKVFFQDESHLIGEVNLVPVRFGPRDPTGTVRSLQLFIGTHDGVRYVKANYQTGTAEPVDVEGYMTSMGFSNLSQFTLYVKVVEVLTVYKIKPCLSGGTGESIQILKTVSSPEIPGSVAFTLPQTWTGTYVTTQTWQTQTIYVTGTKTVTMTWVVPSTMVVISPTTIQGVTFTGVSTVFSGWTTVVTVTNEPPPIIPSDWCSIAIIGGPLCSLIDWVKGTTFGIPNWLIFAAVVFIALWILLWILSKLFAPRVSVGG
jgi:hypothetical protein